MTVFDTNAVRSLAVRIAPYFMEDKNTHFDLAIERGNLNVAPKSRFRKALCANDILSRIAVLKVVDMGEYNVMRLKSAVH